MSEEILNKLQEHDKQLELIASTVAQHTERLDKIDAKLENHDKQLDRIIVAVVQNQEDIKEMKETMVTKADIAQLVTSLDEYVGLARKKDQELLFMGERVNRVEEDVAKIKPLVGLA